MNNKRVDCIFCSIPRDRIISENDLTFAIRDNYPVTTLHSLIIPKRHVADYFSLTEDELMYICCNENISGKTPFLTTDDAKADDINLTASIDNKKAWKVNLYERPNIASS